jgi:hypothetical protein
VDVGTPSLETARGEGEMMGGEGGFSERVAVVRKGEVLRHQQRQKDRPPDPQHIETLRLSSHFQPQSTHRTAIYSFRHGRDS